VADEVDAAVAAVKSAAVETDPEARKDPDDRRPECSMLGSE
jgi:hypothetical protein